MRDSKGRFIKGHILPNSWRKSMIEKKVGVTFTDAHKLAISKGNTGKKRTIEHRLKYRLCKLGEKHYKYNGGTDVPLIKYIRNLQEYKNWRNSIFKRDGYKCKLCGFVGYIEAHHIVPFSTIIKYYNLSSKTITKEELIMNAKNYGQFWDINNGITLCRACHIKEDSMRGKRGKAHE
jgi:5-methylcytosine-specific restriction endonuclease McrA